MHGVFISWAQYTSMHVHSAVLVVNGWPFSGDVFADPDLLVPKVADREILAGVYEVVGLWLTYVADNAAVMQIYQCCTVNKSI